MAHLASTAAALTYRFGWLVWYLLLVWAAANGRDLALQRSSVGTEIRPTDR